MAQTTVDEPVAETTQDVRFFTHWIDGGTVASPGGPSADVYDPATGKVIGRVARGGSAEVDRAVVAARVAFPGWRDASFARRTDVLFTFRELVNRHRDELAALVVRDHGKTLSDALGGVLRGIEAIDYACGIADHMLGGYAPNASTNVDTYSIRQPLGVVGCITPFNFPVMVPMWMYPLALACGNAVVLKPSSHTPHATLRWASTVRRSSAPSCVSSAWKRMKTLSG